MFKKFIVPFAGLMAAVSVVSAATEAPGPAAGSGHWAFEPVKMPEVPAGVDQSRLQSRIDAFVVARLARNGLTLAPAADAATLVRRVFFNLIGLPPTPAEIEPVKTSADFSQLVDRLLADPRFGERWGRYWLDVARYADSKGYVFQEERRYPYSYTYRDWVIDAFNADLPYDRFITAQVAADQSLAKEDPRHHAAMGFLTLGRRFLNNESDIIDDRIDVTFRGLQGLTVGCARCHDHKFDPIPSADYYSLYGIFASSEEPGEKPLLGNPQQNAAYSAFEEELKKRESAAGDYLARKKAALFEAERIRPFLQLCAEAWDKSDDEIREMAKQRQIYRSVAVRWRERLKQLGEKDALMAPWFAALRIAPDDFVGKYPAALDELGRAIPLNAVILEALQKAQPASASDVHKVYAEVFSRHHGETALDQPDAEAVRRLMTNPELIAGIETRSLMRDFSVEERNKARELRNRVEEFKATSENAPARGMVMIDKARPVQPRIFKRGNPRSPGEEVARQFPACVLPARKPFQQGSGRLELAQAIASRENPLTARVIVNRVWGWLTGQPLVSTPSDFGVRTTPPGQPELLEYLAASFMENGWSVKSLAREILLSSTWQQSATPAEMASPARPVAGVNPSSAPPTSDSANAGSLTAVVAPAQPADPGLSAVAPASEAAVAQPAVKNPSASSIDPENALLWKMNRRRRDFESFRDSLLTVSGRLDPRMGGRPVDINNAAATRRTIYGFIDRQNLPGLFRTFDFASPDQHAPQRFQTTVPQQALFGLNNAFVIEQARALAANSRGSDEARVERIYRSVLSRAPEPAEMERSLNFLRSGQIGQTTGAWEYGWGRFDEAAGRVEFHRLPHFGGERWSGSAQLPDPQLGWVMLDRRGGHPGDGAHAAILRWRAPAAATVRIEGRVQRAATAGDGVRVHLVSDRRGCLCTWDATPATIAELAVDALAIEEGEVLDFVIDPRADEGSDSFQFAPRIIDAATGSPMADSEKEFAGPALDPWVAFAQVLLLSNEFMFVD